MKKFKNYYKEISVTVILSILTLLITNPFDILMLDKIIMILLILLAVMFFIFSSLIFNESNRDEREYYHSMFAGRIAFITGSTLLTIITIIQGIRDEIDFFVPFTLAIMITAKTLAHIYSKMKN